jgi:hypothetical protein
LPQALIEVAPLARKADEFWFDPSVSVAVCEPVLIADDTQIYENQ